MIELAVYAEGEIKQVVAYYEWQPENRNDRRYNVTINIKLYKNPDSSFMAYPSHSVKKPKHAGAYMSIESKPTVEAAIQDCTGGFKAFMGTVSETKWLPNDDF